MPRVWERQPGLVHRLVVPRSREASAFATRASTTLPELPVNGFGQEDGVDLATYGIVDALCIGEDGKPELVIN
jgi:hypothetical protein